MKILFHIKGVALTEQENNDIEEKLQGLSRFVTRDEPVTIDLFLIDEAGKRAKNGPDQIVHINALLSGENIFIEERNSHHMQAFSEAYHRFKRALEDRHRKMIDEAKDSNTMIE
ncbi:MAG: HPF/RaiA family ribosome-associated protein [Patescibacteria group bacterium]|jgi:ribosome-associated translation inhibitor RaiA